MLRRKCNPCWETMACDPMVTGEGLSDLRLIAQRDLVGAPQVPWSPYSGTGVDVATRAELSPEAAQQKAAPGVKRSR